MNSIAISSVFQAQDGYRLLAVGPPWLKKIASGRSLEYVGEKAVGCQDAAGIKRPRRDSEVVIVLKGGDQLSAHDMDTTQHVRRVEYSNTLLIASRRWRHQGQDADAVGGPLPLQASEAAAISSSSDPRLRDVAESVVVAELSRLFETQDAPPHCEAPSLLRACPLTLDELESCESPVERAAGGGEEATGGATLYTFAELSRRCACSPTEVANALKNIGAIVHRGYVRSLCPVLEAEALRAVLTFVEGEDPCQASWERVMDHFCPSVYPRVVLESVRAVYSNTKEAQPTGNDSGENGVGDASFLFDCFKVVACLARHIFSESAADGLTVLQRDFGNYSAKGLPFDAFMSRWIDAMPSFLFGRGGVPLRSEKPASFLALLRGCVVCQQSRPDNFVDATVWFVPEETLPRTIPERLDVLFTINSEKWESTTLEAYIRPLLTQGQAFANVIARFAREYRVPGQPRMYARLAAK